MRGAAGGEDSIGGGVLGGCHAVDLRSGPRPSEIQRLRECSQTRTLGYGSRVITYNVIRYIVSMTPTSQLR